MIDDSTTFTESMLDAGSETTAWTSAVESLASAQTYWLATVRPDRRPHVMRVLAVWENGALHFCTSPSSRKGKNLAANASCVIAATSDDLDLVVEGQARPVRDEGELQRIADAYASKYGWRVTVRDGAFHDTEGAATAGPPPYDVYRLSGRVAFGFGAGENDFNPTRWRF